MILKSYNVLYSTKRWANRPLIELIVDKLPQSQDLIYSRYVFGKPDSGELYFAQRDGFVKYYYYNGPSTGFSGARFDLSMDDGSVATLIGPWSSRAGVVNKSGAFPQCVDVHIRADHDRGFFAGSVTVTWLLSQRVPLAEMISHGEPVYEPVHIQNDRYSLFKETDDTCVSMLIPQQPIYPDELK